MSIYYIWKPQEKQNAKHWGQDQIDYRKTLLEIREDSWLDCGTERKTRGMFLNGTWLEPMNRMNAVLLQGSHAMSCLYIRFSQSWAIQMFWDRAQHSRYWSQFNMKLPWVQKVSSMWSKKIQNGNFRKQIIYAWLWELVFPPINGHPAWDSISLNISLLTKNWDKRTPTSF